MLFVRLFGLCLFGFVGFLFLLMSGKGCGLCLCTPWTFLLPFFFCKAFSKFYRRHCALLEKYSVSQKTLLQQGISEPEFYEDLVYRFRKIVGKSNFSVQFNKLINRYKRIGYSLDIMRQTAYLVVNPIIVDDYASLFNCTTAVRVSDSMTASS